MCLFIEIYRRENSLEAQEDCRLSLLLSRAQHFFSTMEMYAGWLFLLTDTLLYKTQLTIKPFTGEYLDEVEWIMADFSSPGELSP